MNRTRRANRARRRPRCPCMVFQHFPIEQYYRLLKPVAATAARAIEGYRNFAGRHSCSTKTKRNPEAIWGRASAARMPTAANSRSLTRRDLPSAGHDHRNAFVGSVQVGTDGDRQMMMVASPTSGFGSYGPVPAKRAARLFNSTSATRTSRARSCWNTTSWWANPARAPPTA